MMFFAACTCDRRGCLVHSCKALVVRDGVYGMCAGPTPCLKHPNATKESDPRGWEALTQQEAEQDARRMSAAEERDALAQLAYEANEREKTLEAELAVAVRERDQARDALRLLSDWARRMPDAGLDARDPRFDWWVEGFEARAEAHAALAEGQA